jgi:2'-hydroxyisoflavone reductase
MKRRDFISNSAALATALGIGMSHSMGSTNNQLKILVLGGTNFVGPAIVNTAKGSNHDVTLFNRGITNPALFPELRLIKGDRELGQKAYDPLKDEHWDIVIDVWPEQSKLVDEATDALKALTDHYIFISSIAVYSNFQEVGLHEASDVVDLSLSKEEWGYAEEKLAAEQIVKKRFPNQHTILRPGPIKGWRDPAFDLLYWCIKLNRDASIIAPGSGLDPIQFIDARDVGRFAIMAAENHLSGIFNCTGPKREALLWREFLTTAREHFKSQTALIWASESFLRDNNVHSFSDLPLWAPLSEDVGFMQISNNKLTGAGFNFSSIQSTLNDCMSWHRNHPDQNIKFGTEEINLGLNRSRELKLISLLKG